MLNAFSSWQVSQLLVHPSYDTVTKQYDLVLLRLSSALTLSSNPAAIVTPSPYQSFVGQSCVLAGWGATSSGAGTFSS